MTDAWPGALPAAGSAAFVLTGRPRWLLARLHQSAIVGHLLPLRPPGLLPAPLPLLVDLSAMPPALVLAMLRDCHRRAAPSVVVLIPRDTPGLARLAAAAAPPVIAVVAETVSPHDLGAWVRRAATACGRGAPAIQVGLPQPSFALPAFTLDILAALAPYGRPAPPTIAAAAAAAAISPRLFAYRLAALRSLAGLSVSRQRPADLAATLYTALTAPILPTPWSWRHRY